MSLWLAKNLGETIGHFCNKNWKLVFSNIIKFGTVTVFAALLNACLKLYTGLLGLHMRQKLTNKAHVLFMERMNYYKANWVGVDKFENADQLVADDIDKMSANVAEVRRARPVCACSRIVCCTNAGGGRVVYSVVQCVSYAAWLQQCTRVHYEVVCIVAITSISHTLSLRLLSTSPRSPHAGVQPVTKTHRRLRYVQCTAQRQPWHRGARRYAHVVCGGRIDIHRYR